MLTRTKNVNLFGLNYLVSLWWTVYEDPHIASSIMSNQKLFKSHFEQVIFTYYMHVVAFVSYHGVHNVYANVDIMTNWKTKKHPITIKQINIFWPVECLLIVKEMAFQNGPCEIMNCQSLHVQQNLNVWSRMWCWNARILLQCIHLAQLYVILPVKITGFILNIFCSS